MSIITASAIAPPFSRPPSGRFPVRRISKSLYLSKAMEVRVCLPSGESCSVLLSPEKTVREVEPVEEGRGAKAAEATLSEARFRGSAAGFELCFG
ncbi:unnamed protein product [Effrenium voratum]|nr:unnamed protein product [Effrenium voratum]